jgi:hypothetical protein
MPSFWRTLAGTEIWPCAVSRECANGMPHITMVINHTRNADHEIVEILRDASGEFNFGTSPITVC